LKQAPTGSEFRHQPSVRANRRVEVAVVARGGTAVPGQRMGLENPGLRRWHRGGWAHRPFGVAGAEREVSIADVVSKRVERLLQGWVWGLGFEVWG